MTGRATREEYLFPSTRPQGSDQLAYQTRLPTVFQDRLPTKDNQESQICFCSIGSSLNTETFIDWKSFVKDILPKLVDLRPCSLGISDESRHSPNSYRNGGKVVQKSS